MTAETVIINGYTHQVRRPPQPVEPFHCLHLGPHAGDEPCTCGSASTVAIYCCNLLKRCCPGNDAEKIQGWMGARLPQNCGSCALRNQAQPIVPPTAPVEPIPVTIGIPVAGQIELLAWVLKLHRLQRGVVPRFILADTLTPESELPALQRLAESPDVTLLTIPRRKCAHTSEPVCDAMQAIYDACETDLLLQTHGDCLPANPWATWDVVRQCSQASPVVGYQMSQRPTHKVWDWRRMVSHTFTAFHRISLGPLEHSMHTAANATGTLAELQACGKSGWPDTESGFGHSLMIQNISPKLIGPELNATLDKTPHYWHVRSLASSAMYSANYFAKALAWKAEAIEQAELWLREWSNNSGK